MSTTLHSVARGLRVALATPYHIEHELAGLITPSPGTGRPVCAPTVAIAAAHRALRLLARIPGSPWRSTCLYRSVAECVLLRTHGVGAWLCLGIDRQPGSTPVLEAHAWVETSADGLAPRSSVRNPTTVRLVGPRAAQPSGP